MASVLDLVKHYQHTIEKYPTDEHKVLKCIDKLYNLAVTVQHLQETGVGRTVNALRKEAGDVGQAARALVYKWKLMVASEESDQETDQNNDSSTHNGHGSGKDSDDNAQSRTKPDRYERSNSSSKPKDHREINGNYSGSKKRYHSSEDEESTTKRSKHSSSSEDDYKRKSHGRVKKPETESESDGSQSDESDSEESDSSLEEAKVKQEIKKEHNSHKLSSSKHSSHDEHGDHKSSSSSRPYEPEKDSRHYSSQSKERHSSETNSTKEKYHSSDKHKSSKEKESNSEKKLKSDAEKSHKESKSSARHSLEKQSSSDKHSGSEKHGSFDKHRSSSSHKSDSGSDKNKTSSDKHSKSDKHKSSSHLHASEKEKHKSSSEKDSERSKHKVKESTSNSSSSKEKHSSSSKDKSKDSSSSKEKLSSHSSEKKHSSSSDNKSNSSSSKGHSEKDEKGDKKSKHRSSSSSHKSSKSSSTKIEEVPKKKVQIQISEEHDTDDGIDCGSGASFAEALGMISPAKSKKKLLRDVGSPNNDYSPAVLLAPTAKLAPLPTLEISALPEISPNYKPRPPPRAMPHFNDEDAMSCVISSKNQRTKVYSGNKVIGGRIPSLYEMCVNVLQEHIDALEYTGGVPYEILKPVVDRATPQQMFILEHYNPYLMEDTDHLWQKFCQKNFRNKQRQENEAWREMYTRCQEEQEIRLKSLTNNIRIAQEAKKAPIKQTKMAYVDSIAKPPRNIAKKQAQHGTARMATGSPAARVASLAGPNVLRGGAGARALAPLPSAGGSSFKPKKAPLMAKALQIMRGRKR